MKGRRHSTTTRTAITAKHARRQAADTGDEGETATSPSFSPSSSVSRRAALALSLASAASGLLPKAASAASSSSAIVDPSAVDPLLEGGTVTLLKVRGDGRDQLSLSEAVVLDTNRKVHAANGAPVDFPGFVRVGFDIKVVVPIEDEEEEEAEEEKKKKEEEENAPEGGGEGEGGAAATTTTTTTTVASAADETSTSSSSSAPPSPPLPPPARDGAPSSPHPLLLKRGYQITPEGLIYKDYVIGDEGAETPKDGQEVVFDYTAFNESGARIDSSFSKGRPAQARIGVGAGGGLIPGFELGLIGMRTGGRRRLIVPPALGPPIGPQTFFSAKQCEVFDVQLRAVKSCRRRQVAMFSDVVCE